MKYCWTTITVKDMETALAFYQEIIGLKVNRRFKPAAEMEIAFLGDGGTELELICSSAERAVSFGPDISLGFETDSLEAFISMIKQKGLSVLSGPFQPNPYIRFLYIADPDGLKIQLVEKLKSGG